MKQPNIVFILSDQHNAGIAGFAGDPHVKTPCLDTLARQGTVLENCYCNSPLCVPSRASMLTGRLPGKTGVYNNMQSLRSDEPTLAHSLAAGGYETVLAGRMHFTGYDQRHGFEKRLVGDITPTFPRPMRQAEVYGFLKGTPDQSRASIEKSGPGDSAVLHFDADVCSATCSFLSERRDDRPLFITVGFYGPHCPFVAPKDLYEYYMRCLPQVEPADKEEYRSMHPAMQSWIDRRGVCRVSQEELRRVRAAYYGMVTYLDHLAGQVIDAAYRYLGREDTLLIYGSDHGEALGAHGLFWKSNFYESSVKVPFIASFPGTIPNGKHLGEPVSLVDLASTLLDYGQSAQLPDQDGDSLRVLLETGSAADIANRPLISQLIDIKGDRPSVMVRKGRYKMISHCGHEAVQLFDLERDPAEQYDLGTQAAYTQVIGDLKSVLDLYWNADDAEKQLEKNLYEVSLLRKWAAAVSPVGIEEWCGNREDNYLVE